MTRGGLAGAACGVLLAGALVTAPALAQFVGAGSIAGGGGGGVAASLVCLLAGCTMTGAITMSGVTNDVTTAGNEDLTLVPGGGSGTGSVVIQSEDDATDFNDNAGNLEGQIVTNGSVANIFLIRQGNSTTSGAMRLTTATGVLGTGANAGVNTAAATLADSITASGGQTSLVSVYGNGAVGIVAQQSITISSGTDTTSPTSSLVELTCTTPSCDYQPGETSVVDGWVIDVCNVDTADSITITDNSGTTATVRTRGGATITLVANGDCARCVYTGATWGCQ